MTGKLIFWACVLAFILNTGWGFFIPLYPLILRDFGAEPLQIGFTFLLLNFVSAILRFPFGYLADMRGRGKFLLWSCLAGAFASMLAILAKDWTLLTFSFILVGVSIALYYQTQYSLIADTVPSERFGRAYSRLHLLGGIGWLIAPLLAGIFLKEGAHSFLFLAAFLIFITALLPARRLEGFEQPIILRISILDGLKYVWRVGFWLFLAELFSGFVVGFIRVSLPVYLNEILGLDYAFIGFIITLTGIGIFSAQLPGGFLSDKFNRKRVYILTNSLAIPLLLSWSFITEAVPLICFIFAYYFVRGLAWVAIDGLLASSVKHQKALMFGSALAMWRLGFGIGSGICGWVWSLIGLYPIFLIASTFLIVSVGFASRIKTKGVSV
jgi:MFS family permease